MSGAGLEARPVDRGSPRVLPSPRELPGYALAGWRLDPAARAALAACSFACRAAAAEGMAVEAWSGAADVENPLAGWLLGGLCSHAGVCELRAAG